MRLVMNFKKILLTIPFFLLSVALMPLSAMSEEIIIKFATLAPEGSTWMNLMKEMDLEIQKKTTGRVKFKIYPGGVSGDEKDVVRKMRLGQLHAGGFSGVGLGEILPSVRVLDLPFLFRNKKELDFIQEKYFDWFAKAFEESGHILLGWAEVGPVYIFSNEEIHSLQDMKGHKMWMWEGDPLAAALFKALNLAPYPLSVTDVLMALQTGMIDTVYVSPLGAISLQWFTKVKYMMDLPMAISTGAVTIYKSQFLKIAPEDRKIIQDVAASSLKKLTLTSRSDNEKSVQLMKDYGIKVISVTDPARIEEFRRVGDPVRKELTGKLFPQELINGIMKDLEGLRK